MPLSRKTRRVLQTDTVEVPLTADKSPPPPLANVWDLSFAPSDPPLKRFKMPDAVLQRIGRSAAQIPAANAVAEDEVLNAIRARRLAPRPVISAQRMPRFHVKSSSHFANSSDDIIRFDDVPKADATDEDNSSWTDMSSASGDENGGGVSAKAKERREEIDLHFEGFESDELAEREESDEEESDDEESGDEESGNEESGDEEEEYVEETESLDGDEEEGKDEEKETTTKTTKTRQNSDGATEVCGGFGLLERRAQMRDQTRQPNPSKHSPTAPKEDRAQRQPHSHVQNNLQNEAEPFPSTATAHGRRHRYGGLFFETHIDSANASSCHHTLLCLNRPITVQGPCALVGFSLGEVAVGGFYLGRKHLVLLSDQQRAVVTPVRRLKLKNAALETPPTPFCLAHEKKETQNFTILPPRAAAAAAGDGGEDLNAHWTADVEGIFGEIDWDWVETHITSWRARFASKMPSVVLVLQPRDPPPTRRHYFKRHKHKAQKKTIGAAEASDTYMDIPRFVVRRREHGIDAALLPDVMPAVLKQSNGAVVVLGSKGIGKSTLARFLTNGFLSLYGVCYWLDLDLGQPEFTPPGVLSLHCVRRPLLRPRDALCVETVCSFFLGGPQMRCPVATAIAIEQLCETVERIQKRHPVVINTHGWVLSTGRRMSVEVIRRLQPRHIIHLVKEREERWARDGQALMNATFGLNAEALHRRFVVQPERQHKLERLPLPFRASSAGHVFLSSSAHASAWPGTVHTVQVIREAEAAQKGNAAMKPSAVRRDMWQQHLAPLFHFYESRRQRGEGPKENAGSGGKETNRLADAAEEAGDKQTSVLQGALGKFHRIVIADAASSGDITENVVCAALEHSVVAIAVQCGTAGETERGERYSCLSELQGGFPVSFFGFVESTEMEMRETGNIRIRLPLPREVVRHMWTSASPENSVRVSIACTLMDRMDTAALENYF